MTQPSGVTQRRRLTGQRTSQFPPHPFLPGLDEAFDAARNVDSE
jgi:hypothetical protein